MLRAAGVRIENGDTLMNVNAEMDLERLPYYLRRGRVKALLGVSEDTVTKLVRSGVLNPVRLHPKGRAYYKRDELLALMREK